MLNIIPDIIAKRKLWSQVQILLLALLLTPSIGFFGCSKKQQPIIKPYQNIYGLDGTYVGPSENLNMYYDTYLTKGSDTIIIHNDSLINSTDGKDVEKITRDGSEFIISYQWNDTTKRGKIDTSAVTYTFHTKDLDLIGYWWIGRQDLNDTEWHGSQWNDVIFKKQH